jgi:hypothetical protein
VTRRARRRAFTRSSTAAPLAIGLAAAVGLSLWLRGPDIETTAPAGDAGPAETGGPSAALPGDAPPLAGTVLTWRTEGPRDLPAPPDLLGCLAGRNGRTPTLAPVRVGGILATEITWLGPTVVQRLGPSTAGETPGLMLRTALGSRPHAALAAHVALAACVRTGATRLIDTDLGRTYEPAAWPLPLPDGGLDVAALFTQEVTAGMLVTRGLSRVGLPELAIRMTTGLDASTARARLLRAIAAAVVAERVADRLTVDGESLALGASSLPSIGDVRILPAAPPPRPDARPPAGGRASPSRAAPPAPPVPKTAAPLDIDYR